MSVPRLAPPSIWTQVRRLASFCLRVPRIWGWSPLAITAHTCNITNHNCSDIHCRLSEATLPVCFIICRQCWFAVKSWVKKEHFINKNWPPFSGLYFNHMKSHLLHVLLCEHLLLTGCRVRGLLGGGHLHPAHTDNTLDVCHSRLIGWPEHQNPHPCYVQCFLLFIVLCLTVLMFVGLGYGLGCSACCHISPHIAPPLATCLGLLVPALPTCLGEHAQQDCCM